MPALVVEVLDLLAQRIGEGASAAALQEGGEFGRALRFERTVALVVARELRRGSGLRDVLGKLDCQLVPEEEWRPSTRRLARSSTSILATISTGSRPTCCSPRSARRRAQPGDDVSRT